MRDLSYGNVSRSHDRRSHDRRSRELPNRRALLEGICRDPLLVTRCSQRGVTRPMPSARPDAVTVGLGVCTPVHVSRGVPLDVLGLLFGAAHVRELTGAQKLVVLVADAHALRVGMPQAQVLAQSRRLIDVLDRVASACRLPLHVQTATALHDTAEHRAARATLSRRVGARPADYTWLQTADTEALRLRHGEVVKVGWSLGGCDRDTRDERHFDRHYRHWFGERVPFVYAKAGRTLSARMPRTAPYLVSDPTARLLLSPDEDPVAKLAKARRELARDRFRALERQAGHIAAAYERHTRRARGHVAERIEALVRHLFSAPEPPLTGLERPSRDP